MENQYNSDVEYWQLNASAESRTSFSARSWLWQRAVKWREQGRRTKSQPTRESGPLFCQTWPAGLASACIASAVVILSFQLVHLGDKPVGR
ncbi:hypothetical protein T08_14137 [Trichinella sp. T8]|nr:hypothetical protein T08_14137 [Trichinella sp. T8]